MSYEATVAAANSSRRPSKFTPERIQQIRDFIARGETCEDIAAQIGVTVGTLKVTCSRLGISLRRPRSGNGSRLLPLRAARAETAGAPAAIFTISMRYKGQAQDTPLPLTPNMVGQLALEASFRNQKIGELAKDLLQAVMEKGLLQEVLGNDGAETSHSNGNPAGLTHRDGASEPLYVTCAEKSS
jgi:hypothetical protein